MKSWGRNAENARVAVLAVHGRGQTPSDMWALSQRLNVPSARFYAPEANEGSWYPSPFMAPIEENQPFLDTALNSLQGSLAGIRSEGFMPNQTVLWGFSQGACLVSQLLISRPQKHAAAIIFTGGLIGKELESVDEVTALKGLQVLIRSIEDDPWVPRTRVLETASVFAQLGASVDLEISPGNEHIITDESFIAASSLLNGF